MKAILRISTALGLALLCTLAWAQDRTLSGTVTSAEDGEVLIGVNVILKGTATGTISDIDGNFSLSVPEDGGALVFSFIGFATQEYPIGANSIMDVSLALDVTQLSEIVVTALGIERDERSLGYAVQEIDGDEVNTVRTDSWLNNLSGRAAGVHVKNNTNFGGSINVIIRGSSSLTGNNQALFVVDGVPISNQNTNANDANTQSNGQVTGRSGYDYGNAASDIEPNDIESINILKGAAATALYGSRAANGVIMITTKQGKKTGRGVGVTINSNTTFGVIDKSTMPAYQNEHGGAYGPYYSGSAIYPYMEDIDIDGDGITDPVVPFTEDASRGQRFDPNFNVYQYNAFVPESPFFGQRTPWVAAANGPETFFETAVNLTNGFDIQNASDDGSYRFGYTNTNATGVMPNSEIKRNNFRLTGTYDIVEKLKITTSVNYIKSDTKGRPSTGYSDNIMSMFRQWWQTNVDLKEQEDLYNMTGRNVTWNRNSYLDHTPIYWDNPYWVRYENFQKDTRSRILGYAMLDYEITDWLSAMGRVGIDTYDELQEERKAVSSVAGEMGVDRPDVRSGYTRYDRTWRETNIDFMLNFHKRYGEIDLTALVGTNIRRNRMERVFASTNGGLAVPGVYALSNSVDPMLPPEERLEEKGVNGIFGSINAGFKDMVYLEATIRRDVSSTLPEANNSYVYPSVSGTFMFSEVVQADWLPLGKIRVNYAEVGNDAPPLRVSDTYRGKAPFAGNAMATNYFAKNNPDLLPERQKSTEFGLAMNFLENRVGFDVAYYNSSTFNQLMPVKVSQSTGYREQWVNAGEIQNNGVEIMLFATPVAVGDFKWDLTLNWAKNDNKVVSLYTDEAGNEVTNLQLASLQGGVTINARVGEPYGTIHGTEYVFHDNGQPTIASNGRFVISSANDFVIGNANPDFIAGITNAFSYKNFQFHFLIDMQQGGDIFSLDQWYGVGTGLYEETVFTNDLGNPVRNLIADGGGLIREGVQTDGSANTVRVQGDRFSADGWARSPNSRFVYDASFVKLRELVLTYNFPQSILANTPIPAASVSFVGSNLWIISKNLPHADPEASQGSGNIQGWQSGVMPTVKSYGVNLKVSF